MKEINIIDARVYIITDYKNSLNNICGDWLYLIHYNSLQEFRTACEYLHTDEPYPVCLYFDYENIPDAYISHHWISPDIFNIIRLAQQLCPQEQVIFSRWFNYQQPDLTTRTPESIFKAFQFCMEGKYKSPLHFGYHIARESLGINEKSYPCFDFTGYTENLFKDMYLFIDGYVFKNIRIND
ncbi:hypothetical protein M2451_003798 [Dysgonomonas sp. PFB1-18]|uniref:antirestriction protein ArdA n=1 Tax=unclassified Dysgonomonas TaxID=2630389 RepID=UPI002474F27F|nr:MULTISPECIES: antirestriction protein ArdA [unclassified Dysgonomonas]MDH6310934.1 hypothetical protein [Dysgonomonas sp. PF1-14]MDH6340851.1 hypothetical protein [Dysgonomonas sp. PF1-16]MDH6382457.1 hypothetical protein [Dysgonomonas sp. PFB1-18]MDH6399806.1 hypothetical protein [Dysgonomonas sp. PF1-23]